MYAIRSYYDIINFTKQEEKLINESLEGLTFVVTGSVNHFTNRKELQSKIEELGGKCVGSVSRITSYNVCYTKLLRCGALPATDWLEARQRRLLPVPYFLQTYTVPGMVAALGGEVTGTEPFLV